eukprot:1144923-Pelagomonas_calceolata.AAC.1
MPALYIWLATKRAAFYVCSLQGNKIGPTIDLFAKSPFDQECSRHPGTGDLIEDISRSGQTGRFYGPGPAGPDKKIVSGAFLTQAHRARVDSSHDWNEGEAPREREREAEAPTCLLLPPPLQTLLTLCPNQHAMG